MTPGCSARSSRRRKCIIPNERWLRLFRRSSLAGLVASFATPFAMFAFHGTQAALLFVLLTAILWIKHTANIERLLAGTEPKIGAI